MAKLNKRAALFKTEKVVDAPPTLDESDEIGSADQIEPQKWDENDLIARYGLYFERATYLVKYISSKDRIIVDFGAGSMHLKKFLKKGVEYHPVDLIERCDDTIVCDFNKGEFPDMEMDVAVLSGILEYIVDIDQFLDKVSQKTKKIILACECRELKSDFKYSSTELANMLHKKGFIMTDWNYEVPQKYPTIGCFERRSPSNLMRNALCTGCGACRNKCPENAISIHEDELGFLKPALTPAICTNCNQCLDVCPTLLPDYSNEGNPMCYALWAHDEVRCVSTSGGAFTLFADKILDRGGVVFGAGWREDFSVEITEIARKDELQRLRRSKYLQSDVGESYRRVKTHLDMGKPVLYTGCPCQIAGLKRFIGSPCPDGLYVLDILCSHIGPAKAFKEYLKEVSGERTMESVDFRKNTNWTGGYTHTIQFTDESTYIGSGNDPYERAYFGVPRIMTNHVCRDCQFGRIPRQGDITIGDFWGITKKDETWNDEKGTSIILVNNERGSTLLESIGRNCKRLESIPLEVPLSTSNRIDNIRLTTQTRPYFLRLIDSMPFSEAHALVRKEKFDVGIAGMYNRNYGNNITYYALYQTLKDKGLKVVMIDCPNDSRYRNQFKEHMFPMFAHSPYAEYEIANNYATKSDMVSLNDACSTFILGSDQSVRPSGIRHHGDYGYLGWVRSDRKMIAYAVSFASDSLDCSDYMKAEMAFYFRRFDAFSVRERSGLDITQNELGFKSEWVMDPVFLCNPQHYIDLIECIETESLPRNHLGAYIRAPLEWKADIIRYVSEATGLNEIQIIPDGHRPERTWSLKVEEGKRTEEWLANIIHCDFFITDSFHGVCLSLIFHKPFIATFKNINDERANSLLQMLDLEDRIVNDLEDLKSRPTIFEPIDFDYVDSVLKREIDKSMAWLMDGINKKKNPALTGYDLVMAQALKNSINRLDI